MYLYLGQDTVACTADIIGIFDLDNASVSRSTKEYLANAQKTGAIKEVSADIPKSFVVCDKAGKATVYLTHISSATLKKRTGFFKDLSKL